jgi:hypothetical protein
MERKESYRKKENSELQKLTKKHKFKAEEEIEEKLPNQLISSN